METFTRAHLSGRFLRLSNQEKILTIGGRAFVPQPVTGAVHGGHDVPPVDDLDTADKSPVGMDAIVELFARCATPGAIGEDNPLARRYPEKPVDCVDGDELSGVQLAIFFKH